MRAEAGCQTWAIPRRHMTTRLFKQGMDFKCIGSQCVDSCCSGWDITFDQGTYVKLSQDPCFKKTMADYASINDDDSLPNINYGIISLAEHESCPFLDGDALCRVHKKRGEEGLSSVCALYPRYYNTVDGVYEESLSLACIEATESLLFGEPLEVIEVDRGPKRDVVFQNIETAAGDNRGSGIRYLYDFRKVIFGLISSEDLTFDQKLGMLMTFHQYIEAMEEDALKGALDSYDFNSKKMTIAIDESTYRKLIDFLKRVGRTGHLELDDLLDKCIKGSDHDQENLKKLNQDWLSLDKLPNLDRIMSNYLIHQMFKDLYPFIGEQSKMDSFQYLLKKVQILRLLIACDGNLDDKNIDDKRVARIIQMFTKGLEHHAAFHYELEDLIL